MMPASQDTSWLLEELERQPDWQSRARFLEQHADAVTPQLLRDATARGRRRHEQEGLGATLSPALSALAIARWLGEGHAEMVLLKLVLGAQGLNAQTSVAEQITDDFLQFYLERARRLAAGGLTEARSLFMELVRKQCVRAVSQGDLGTAQTLLLDALHVFRSSSWWEGIIDCSINLSMGFLQGGNIQRSADYALMAHGLLSKISNRENNHAKELIEGIGFCLLEVVTALYYRCDLLTESAELAELATPLLPKNPAPHFFIGICALRQGDMARAETAWEQAISIAPERAAFRFNYAVAIHHKNPGKALEEINIAIERDPTDPLYRMQRGSWLSAVSRHHDAIADYDAAIERLGNRTEITTSHKGRQDGRELRRTLLRARTIAYHQAGLHHKAQAEMYRLRSDAEPKTAALGHRLLAEQYERAEDDAAAAVEFQRASELEPDETLYVLRRARCLVRIGRLKAAVSELEPLIRKREELSGCIEILSSAITQLPDEPSVLKWLGIAYFQAAENHQGASTLLSRAAAMLPFDSDLHYFRGICRAVTSPAWEGYSEQKAPTTSFPIRRILAAIDDLARAIDLDPTHQPARHALLWILERLLCNSTGFLMLGLSLSPYFATPLRVIPQLARMQEHHVKFAILSGERKYEPALELALSCLRLAEEANLRLYAASLHLNIVDIYLQLGKLQPAIDHLRKGKRLEEILAESLSDYAREKADQENQRQLESAANPVFAIELEYLQLVSLPMPQLGFLFLMQADVAHRLGQTDQAIEYLQRFLRQNEDPVVMLERYSLNAVLRVVQILRDHDRHDEALDIMCKIAPSMRDDAYNFENTFGTVLSNVGQTEAALERFQRARATGESSARTWVTDINIASCLVDLNRSEEALHLLERIDVEAVARSLVDHTNYHQLMAKVLSKQERHGDAKRHIMAAIAANDERRASVRTAQSRLTLGRQASDLYQQAMRIALRDQDVPSAFLIAERARARVLLDDLTAGTSSAPQAAATHQELLNTLKRKQKLLEVLAHQPQGDPSTLAQLMFLDRKIDIFETGGDGTKIVSHRKIAELLPQLTARIDVLHQDRDEERQARAAHRDVTEPISWEEFRAVLASAS